MRTDRFDLVEQLEKALTDEAYDGGNGALNEEQFTKLVLTLATTAVNVIAEEAKPLTFEDLSETSTSLEDLIGEARSEGVWCCENGCGSGACETCPCCSAGWCVSGIDGIPDDPEARAWWLEVAAEYNPVAAALRAAGGFTMSATLLLPTCVSAVPRLEVSCGGVGSAEVEDSEDERHQEQRDDDHSPQVATAREEERGGDGPERNGRDDQVDRVVPAALQCEALLDEGWRHVVTHTRSIATCVARLPLLRRVLAEFNEAGFDLLRFFFQADLCIAHGESAPDADAAQPRIVMRVPDLAKASAQALDLVTLVVGHADSVLKPERGTDV